MGQIPLYSGTQGPVKGEEVQEDFNGIKLDQNTPPVVRMGHTVGR